jgi:hypothetical protein
MVEASLFMDESADLELDIDDDLVVGGVPVD